MSSTHAVTASTATPCQHSGAFAPERQASPLITWLRAVRAAFLRRRTVALLGALTDRELQDIGLHRSEVLSTVHGPAAEERRRSYVGP